MKHIASRSLVVAAFVGGALLGGCVHVAPIGTAPKGCSGIPSDPDPPKGDDAIAPASAPTANEPIELVAVARPVGTRFIPLLYVFDDHARPVTHATPPAKVLTDPIFVQVEAEAYWSEVASGSYYRVPWFDACSQASMLKEPLSFRAPPGGLLFIQYLASSCNECTQLTSAIRGVIAAHPEVPVRWVRIRVPSGVGQLNSG